MTKMKQFNIQYWPWEAKPGTSYERLNLLRPKEVE